MLGSGFKVSKKKNGLTKLKNKKPLDNDNGLNGRSQLPETAKSNHAPSLKPINGDNKPIQIIDEKHSKMISGQGSPMTSAVRPEDVKVKMRNDLLGQPPP